MGNDRNVKIYKMKILFVCHANVNRSPTWERWFQKNRPQYEVKSCGTHYGYPTQLSKDSLEWADKVFVMDLEQEVFISKKYPECLNKVEVIGISDEYDPEDERLIELIEYWTQKNMGP
jgi:predicted protein tyrosine phosphatase